MKQLIILFTFLPAFLQAQTNISGTVTDKKGEPVLGANIYIKDAYDGASSGINGEFEFTSFETGAQILVISSIGFNEESHEVILNGKSIILNVELQEAIMKLNAVTISAGSFEASDKKKSVILKPLDIATTAGAMADIAGALNTLPGTQKVGESGRLFVRGGQGYETKTFIDGMQVMNEYETTGGNVPSRNRFSPFIFKGTSFSTGAYSAEYGQGLSSALILNSKDIADIDRTDIGLMTVGADVAHTKTWEESSFSGKLQYTNLTPYFALAKQNIEWNKAPESVVGNFAYRKNTSSTGVLKFYGNVNHSDMNLITSDILDPSLKTDQGIKNNYVYFNTAYKEIIGEKTSFNGGVSFTHNHNSFISGSQFDTRENGGHIKGVINYSHSDRIGLKIGTESFFRSYSESIIDNEYNNDFSDFIQATFIESELYASAKFIARIGARSEYSSLTNNIITEPRVSLAYKTGESSQFSAGYGKFHQTAQNEYVLQNNSIRPERADHYILNYQITKNKRTFRVEGYYKDYRKLIKFESTEINNQGSGFAKGFDVFWRDNQSFSNVDYWVSYSYLDTEREYLSFDQSYTPTFASKHNFSFVYKHFISSIKSQLGVTYSYTSGRPYHDPNLDGFNQKMTKSYQDLSFNIAYLYSPNVIVYSAISNILGRDNVFGYEYSSQPNGEGQYVARPIQQAQRRFIFLGVFITLSKNKLMNQLPNL